MDGSRLEQTVENVVRTTHTVRLAAGNPAKPFRVEPGLKVGEYVIIQKVASGGMGSIYSAQHPILGKRAAIKMVKAELSADADVLERFVREAQAVNLIQHPNIIDVFSIGSLPNGRPYFVMEWLEGENLAERIARPPAASLAEISAILLPVVDAIVAAHAAGIVHRDLKPSNIFLAQRSGTMVVKVLDFGIAKLRGRTGGETATGVVIGTPAYLAPEQWSTSKVDHRADVYALGVVAYELLTGHRPPASDVETEPRAAVPSVADKRQGVPPELDRVIARMMSDDPEQRPPLAELASVLKSLGSTERAVPKRTEELATTPMPGKALALAPTLPSPAPGPVPRRWNPWLVRLASAGAVAGVAIAIIVASQSSSSGESKTVAVAAPRDAAIVMREPPAIDAARAEPDVQFDIHTAADGARIELDGRFVSEGTHSASVHAKPGDHDVVVTAPGRVTFKQHAKAGAGTIVAIEAELPATPSPAKPDHPATPASTPARVRALYQRTGAAVDQLVSQRDDAHAKALQSEYLSISSPFATDDPQQLRDIEQQLVKLSGKLH